jgi:hypothetical protein
MRCESYQKALVEAAASSDLLPVELRHHTDECSSCRAMFERERSLFASIDLGIRQAANAEVPPSLLPTLRVRLTEEALSAPERAPIAGWLCGVLAAAFLLALLPLLRPRNATVELADRVSAGSEVGSTGAQGIPLKTELIAPRSDSATKPRGSFRRLASAGADVRETVAPLGATKLEVLVPPNQELLLTRYVLAMHRRPAMVLAAGLQMAPSVVPSLDSIEITELQFPQLPELVSK